MYSYLQDTTLDTHKRKFSISQVDGAAPAYVEVPHAHYLY